MLALSYQNTMRGAKQVVHDPEADLPRLRAERSKRGTREALIALSRRWQARQDAARRQKQAEALRAAVELENEARKHRRTRPFIAGDHGATPRVIISMVAAWHGVSVEDIMAQGRSHPVIAARFDAIVAVYLNCRIDGRRLSLQEIGKRFANRDHSTIKAALARRGVRSVGKGRA